MSTLSYNECDIDRGAIASARESFGELHTLISGRSGEYNTITRHVGFEFSDLIGEGLRGAANENQFAWSSSMMACTHAYGILDKISTDVQWYEEKIEEIKANLSQAITDCSEPDNLTLVNQITESHNLDAERAWRDLEERCDESEEMLKEGPTPENIRLLAEGGYFGNNENIGFYTTGDFDYYHVDEGRAEAIATHIGHAVLDGNEVSIELLEENPEYLELISVVVSRGLLAQQNGEKLLDGEVEFLETLFGDLGEIGGENPGFLEFMDQVNSSEHIDSSLREDINRHLANSMLILSDEDIGGGMNQLPQDVSDILDVPDFPDVNSLNHDSELPGFMDAYSDWGGPFSTLSTLLESSGPGVQGGTEFSTTLMGTVAATLDISYFAGEPNDEHFQNIIDVASRNEEANHIIITGEDFEGNTFQHHASHGGLTPESILETFYTHDWDDDGAAVRGITDWIAEDAASPEDRMTLDENSEIRPELSLGEQRSAEALAALVEYMEDDDFREAMFSTGHEVSGDDDVTWRNVAAGHLNPEVAESWSDIFISYMDVFANSEGLGNTDDETDYDTRWDYEQNRVYLSPDGRQYFMEIIMGDADAAQRTYNEVVYYGAETMGDFSLPNGPREHSGANSYGSLLGLVDVALENESERRSTDNTEAVNHANKVRGAVVDTIGGFAGDKNVSGVIVEVAKFLAKEAIEISDNPPAGNSIDTAGDWMPQEDMELLAISALAANDPDVMDALEELHPGAVMGEGEDRYIPLDPHEWEINEESQAAALANMYDYVDELPWVDGEGTTKSAVDNFLGTLGMAWGKW